MPGGHLIALQTATGAARWEVAVGEPRGATELERVADLSGAPVILGGDVCSVSYQGRIGCFDIRTGNPHWTKNLSSIAGIAADEQILSCRPTKRCTVTAPMRRDTGSNVWSNKTLAYRNLSTPVSFGRAVGVE